MRRKHRHATFRALIPRVTARSLPVRCGDSDP